MQRTKHRVSLALIIPLFFASAASASPPGVVDFAPQNTVHIMLWALSEAIPGSPEAARPSNNPYAYAAQKIREAAPFLIEGMVYGWKFAYTPSDISRGVEEFFAFEPILTLSQTDAARIQYTQPWHENNKINCWVDFELSETMLFLKQQWQSIAYRRVKGRGHAPLVNGFDGIKEAATESLKSAVREYARGILKNKPRELTGNVLVVNSPFIGINAGRYQLELDFFLELTSTVSYRLF
jgi:hypothetical protein